MFNKRKLNILAGSSGGRFRVAILFLACATFSAVVHAATRSVEGLEFDSVVVYGSVDVEIAMGEAPSLRVRGDDEALDKQPFYVRGDTLYLGRSDRGKKFSSVKYKLVAADLKSISLRGSGDVYVKPIEVPELELEVDGSGEMKLFSVSAEVLDISVAGSGAIQLAEARAEDMEVSVAGSGEVDLGIVEAGRLEVSMSGSGDIQATENGRSELVDVNLAGSGDIDLGSVQAQTVGVNIAGSGDVTVWAEVSLEANIMGSGDVRYHGEPKIESRILGSGDVVRKK